MYYNSTDSKENKYTYNGKEEINSVTTGLIDYGFRHFDASIGVFTSTDPLSSKFSEQSPYVYASNNPIRYIDFKGLLKWQPSSTENDNSRSSFIYREFTLYIGNTDQGFDETNRIYKEPKSNT